MALLLARNQVQREATLPPVKSSPPGPGCRSLALLLALNQGQRESTLPPVKSPPPWPGCGPLPYYKSSARVRFSHPGPGYRGKWQSRSTSNVTLLHVFSRKKQSRIIL